MHIPSCNLPSMPAHQGAKKQRPTPSASSELLGWDFASPCLASSPRVRQSAANELGWIDLPSEKKDSARLGLRIVSFLPLPNILSDFSSQNTLSRSLSRGAPACFFERKRREKKDQATSPAPRLHQPAYAVVRPIAHPTHHRTPDFASAATHIQ